MDITLPLQTMSNLAGSWGSPSTNSKFPLLSYVMFRSLEQTMQTRFYCEHRDQTEGKASEEITMHTNFDKLDTVLH